MGTIEQRLEALERQFHRARWRNRVLAFALVVVVCVAGAQISQPQAPKSKPPTTPTPADRTAEQNEQLRSVEADQFVLRDRQGRARITLAVTDAGPAISMFDEQGQKRLELTQSPNASAIRLLDPSEAPVASLQALHDGQRAEFEIKSAQGRTRIGAGGVGVWDKADNARLQLALINGNFPVLGISQSGQKGPSSVEITAGNNGARGFKMHDADGRPLLSMSVAENGTSYVNMRHSQHERTLQISTGAKSEDGPQIAFFTPSNQDGSGGLLPRLQLGLRTDQQPSIRIADADGKPLFTAPGR